MLNNLYNFRLFTGVAFYTFAQFLGDVGGDIFMTVALTGIISTPGPIICVFIITRVGRKTTVWIFQFLTGLCFIALLMIPRGAYSNDWPRLLFAGIGFASMAVSQQTIIILYANKAAVYIYPLHKIIINASFGCPHLLKVT